MSRRGLALLAVAALALAARLPLLAVSSLPVNVDAFAQIDLAEDLLATGRWTLGEDLPNAYNRKMPALPVLLATASSLTGVDPLILAPVLMVLVGVGTVVGGTALVHRVTGRRGPAAGAGLVLALLGPFLFVSATVIKEALALALLPVLLLLFLHRSRPAARLAAAALLLLLPLVHHLSMAMAYGFVAFLVLLDATRAHWDGRLSLRTLALDVGLGPALFPVGAAYYQAVQMEFFTDVWNPDEVALFLATAFLMAAAAVHLVSDKRARPWFALGKDRRVPSLLDQKAVVVIGGFLLVAANAVRPLVPGTVATTPLLLLGAAAYVPLTLVALVGFNLHRLSSRPTKVVPIALLLAPLTFLVFSLLRGLDPLSHLLAYRSVDFLDLGLALVIGTALVRGRRRRRAALALLVTAALLATLPLAYATEDAFQVQNVTYGYEWAAARHLAAADAREVATDQRLAAVLNWYFHLGAGGGLPLRLLQDRDPAPGSLLLLETNWATRGAQVHPLPFQVVDPGTLDRLVGNHHLVYHGGDAGNGVYGVRVRA